MKTMNMDIKNLSLGSNNNTVLAGGFFMIVSLFLANPLNVAQSEMLSPSSPDQVHALDKRENRMRVAHAKELMGDEYGSSVVKLAERDYKLPLFIYQKAYQALPVERKDQAWKATQAILEEARRYRFDPVFLMAVIAHESRFRPDIVGSFGEIGLMQVKPDTAQWIAEKFNLEFKGEPRKALRDVAVNIRVGAAYMAFLRKRFPAQGELYMAAYNMGAGNVKKALDREISPQKYPAHVMKQYLKLYTELNKFRKTMKSRNLAMAK